MNLFRSRPIRRNRRALRHLQTPGAHRFRNVFQILRTHVFKGDIDLPADLPLCVVGYADTAGLRNPLQPRSNIDSVPEDIVVIDDDIADVNADPELDSVVMWHVGI